MKISGIFLGTYFYTAIALSQSWKEADSLGTLFLNQKKYPEAENILLNGINNLASQDTTYANFARKLGLAYYYQGKLDQTEYYWTLAKDIRKKWLGDQNNAYISTVNNLALLYVNTGRFSDAEKLYLEIVRVRKSILGIYHPDYQNSLNNLAGVYYHLGNYLNAVQIMEELLQINKEMEGETTINHAGMLSNVALQHIELANYEIAELYLKQAVEIQKMLNEQPDLELANSLNNLGVLYNKIGMYTSAYVLYEEALLIKKMLMGEENADYASSLFNLALLNTNRKQYTIAEKQYLIALSVYQKIGAQNSADYAKVISNLGGLYAIVHQYDKADSLYQTALQLKEKLVGKNHPDYMASMHGLGVLYEEMYNFSKAEELYIKTIAATEKIAGKSHPDYLLYLNNLALLYGKTGKKSKAMKLHLEALALAKDQIQTLFPALSEKEKLAYFNENRSYFNDFTGFALRYRFENPAIVADLYNQTLFTKGIVFSSTVKMRNKILSSGDSVLISKFNDWISLKEYYQDNIVLTIEEQKENEFDKASILAEINDLEKEISLKSRIFDKNRTIPDYKWEQVVASLKADEVAIEIIRYDAENSAFNASENIKYLALIVTKNTKKYPEMIEISNGDDLENKYFKSYRNAIQYYLTDELSYRVYWKPIEDKLKSLNNKPFSKIYLAVDGIYHQVNLNTLLNPENNQYLIDQYNIQLVGSTRDIIGQSFEAKNSQQIKSATLFGFPTYNLENLKSEITGSQRGLSGLQRLIAENESIPLLPGTKKEVEIIESYFNEKSIKSEVFIGDNATEGNLKETKAGDFLHIATHGFFLSNAKNQSINSTIQAQNRELLSNSFLRSGLLFAGCQNTKFGIDDGILTAEEAMNLDLDHTQLVILSACETGLGDIQYGEGVYGLQRAFQQAGAKAVIMSLWKVNDEATQMLVTDFYKNLLMGSSIAVSFRNAQLSLKQNYPQPALWGPFVLMGE